MGLLLSQFLLAPSGPLSFHFGVGDRLEVLIGYEIGICRRLRFAGVSALVDMTGCRGTAWSGFGLQHLCRPECDRRRDADENAEYSRVAAHGTLQGRQNANGQGSVTSHESRVKIAIIIA